MAVNGTPGLTLAGRLLDVADHACDTRAAAAAEGDHKTALHAGQAEARVLVALAPLDALGTDIAEAIRDAEDALRLIGTVVREHPEVAAVIVNVLEQKNPGRLGGSDPADGRP